MSEVIAIVGRPNVGKSALFNRLAGRRIAIVHDRPGVTRDRVTAEVDWGGRRLTLVDTGGIGHADRETATDSIASAALDQVRIAIESAGVILFVVNVQEGVVPLDREVAARLHRSAKPIVMVVNKVDHGGRLDEAGEFAGLGFSGIFPVSAIHGRGISDMMDAAVRQLPDASAASLEDPGRGDPLKLAIVGRPNVGKSSLINALTRSTRVVVSPVPGTTRDAVDVPMDLEVDGTRQRCLLIDTAGIRKSRRVTDSIEYFSVKRSEDSIARCDIAILVLDAEAGVTEQDKKIGGIIQAERKACIVVVNKWDLVETPVREARQEELRQRRRQKRRDSHGSKMTTLVEFGGWVHRQLFFLDFAPVIFASAHSGFHLDRLVEAVHYVGSQLHQRIPTALLNRTLQDAIERQQPVSADGQRLKFFYATQTLQLPPTFLLFVNRQGLFSETYARYLEGRLREAFGYEGCPIVLVPKARPKTIEPLRSRRNSTLRPQRDRNQRPVRAKRARVLGKRR